MAGAADMLLIRGQCSVLPALESDCLVPIPNDRIGDIGEIEDFLRRRLKLRVPFALVLPGGEEYVGQPGTEEVLIMPAFPKGTRVRARDMKSRSDLNGLLGSVIMCKEGRFGIAFDSGDKGMLTSANLQAVDSIAEIAAQTLKDFLASTEVNDEESWVELEPEPCYTDPFSMYRAERHSGNPYAISLAEMPAKTYVQSNCASTVISQRTRASARTNATARTDASGRTNATARTNRTGKGVPSQARSQFGTSASMTSSTASNRPPPTLAIRPRRVSRMHTKGHDPIKQHAEKDFDPHAMRPEMNLAMIAASGGGPLSLTADALAAQQVALAPLPREDRRQRMEELRIECPLATVQEIGEALARCAWMVEAARVFLARTAAPTSRYVASAASYTAVVALIAVANGDCEDIEEEVAVEVLSCRKCRRQLFTTDMLAPHIPPTKTKRDTFRRNKGISAEGVCHSLWLQQDQVDWADAQAAEGGAGTLSCPSCATKLGTFSWSGLQCSCGGWEAPGLQIGMTRVDRNPLGGHQRPTRLAAVQESIVKNDDGLIIITDSPRPPLRLAP